MPSSRGSGRTFKGGPLLDSLLNYPSVEMVVTQAAMEGRGKTRGRKETDGGYPVQKKAKISACGVFEEVNF